MLKEENTTGTTLSTATEQTADSLKEQANNLYRCKTILSFYSFSLTYIFLFLFFFVIAGHLEDAIHLYKQVFDLSPNSSILASNLSLCYLKCSEYETAEHWAELSLLNDPTNVKVRRKEERLDDWLI